MKIHIRVLYTAVLFAILAGAANLFAVDEAAIKSKLTKALHSRNSNGRFFWLAFPPNETETFPLQTLGIYVASQTDNTVTLRDAQGTLEVTKKVKAFGLITFSTAADADGAEITWGYEIRAFAWERVSDFGAVSISAQDPVSVYVLNSKVYSSDGYLAIPVNNWGTKYIHCSYYDFLEAGPYASGFTIIAAEDKTTVEIKLQDGISNVSGFAKTFRGRVIGDTWKVTMNKGEIYHVCGDAKTRGVFDMSGSIITSTKPVGLISSHMRVMIPSTVVVDGRNHLAEMIPPVSTWGKEFATVEYARKSDKGDLFRVVASEPNTRFSVKWYNKDNGKIIGSINEILLPKVGDIWEYKMVGAAAPHDFESIRGVTVLKADKPVLMMQYSMSAQWDGNGEFDPFMIIVTPLEQYTTGTIFQTPRNFNPMNEYTKNFFNLIAVGDSSDEAHNQELLGTVKIDDKFVVDIDPSFALRRIPTTNLYWSFLTMEVGPHNILGETPFGGYIYGFASFDSYGWPAATAFRDLAFIDTLAPIIVINGLCGDYLLDVTDDPEHPRNGKETDDPRQLDVGVSGFPAVLAKDNFGDPYFVKDNGNPGEWSTYPPNYKFKYKVEILDKYKDAFIEMRAIDDANNDTTYVIRYEADSITVDPALLDFGQVRVNTVSPELIAKVSSHSDSVITIKSLKLKKGGVFTIAKIVDGAGTELTPEFKLQPRQDIFVHLSYKPDKEYPELKPEDYDLDSLIVETSCLYYNWPVRGQGIEPKIIVSDYNAGTVPVNTLVTSVQRGEGEAVVISNPGTMDLIVTGIQVGDVQAPFSTPNMAGTYVFATPLTIKPQGRVTLYKDEHQIDFLPLTPGQFQIDVHYISNATVSDNLSVWRGAGQTAGPRITSHDFGKHRSKSTTGVHYLEITNEVDDIDDGAPVRVTGVEFKDPSVQDFILDTSVPFKVEDGNGSISNVANPFPVNIFPLGKTGTNIVRVFIPVRYNPQSGGDHSNLVVAKFTPETDPDYEVAGVVEGRAVIPQIKVSNYTFDGKWEINTVPHQTGGQTTVGIVNIINETKGVDTTLRVFSVGFDNAFPDKGQFFEITGNPIADPKVKPWAAGAAYDIPFGDTVKLLVGYRPIQFSTNTDLSHVMRFAIESDAGEYDVANNRDPRSIEQDGGVVTAYPKTTGVETTNIDYGLQLGCADPVLPAMITNNNTDDDIQVKEIRYVSGDNWFSLTNDPAYPLLVTKGGGNVSANFTFNAGGPAAEGTYSAVWEWVTTDDVTYPFTIRGEVETVTLDFDLDEYSYQTNRGIAPGIKMDYPVRVKITDGTYALGAVDNVTVEIRYKSKWIIVEKDGQGMPIVKKGTMLDDDKWTLTAEEFFDPDFTDGSWKILSINLAARDAQGNPTGAVLDGDGTLAVPFLYLLLSDEKIYTPEFGDIRFTGKEECVYPVPHPGEFQFDYCVENLRPIVLKLAGNGGAPQINSLSPNPAFGDEDIDVKFGVDLYGPTTITITNPSGERVGIPYQKVLDQGSYEATLSSKLFTSGLYFLTIEQRGFSVTKEILITK